MRLSPTPYHRNLFAVIVTPTSPWPLDNMEGVALRRGPSGETLIYLISDDNYNALQRTILLHFALRE